MHGGVRGRGSNPPTYSIDHSGNFIGQYGAGNDIVIASSIYDAGTPFSVASPDTVGRVLTTLGKSLGISGNINIGYKYGENYASTDSNGQITFNYLGNVMASDNYYDFLSVLNHEHHHQNTLQDFGTTQSEINALFYEMMSPFFYRTSDSYRQNTLDRYNYLVYGSAGIGNY